MQRVVNIVEQLGEAGRFLRIGTLAYSRMALLLLDNAAEVITNRAIFVEIEHDDWWAREYKSARSTMPTEVADSLIKESGYALMPDKLKKAAGKLFVPKVELLVNRGRIDSMTGEVIKGLHRYRNDAYHRDKIRRETLKTAATLYFEVVCELFVSLPPDAMIYLGTDDWSEFMTRFGLKGPFIVIPDGLQTIVAKLRRDIGIEGHEVAKLLADHLESRLDSLFEQLEFISENTSPQNTTPAEELIRVQFWKERGPLPWDRVNREFRTFKAKCTEKEIAAWRNEATLIRQDKFAAKLDLLRRFWEVEHRLEPVEGMVNEVASEIDCAIQFEIDRFRGR